MIFYASTLILYDIQLRLVYVITFYASTYCYQRCSYTTLQSKILCHKMLYGHYFDNVASQNITITINLNYMSRDKSITKPREESFCVKITSYYNLN